MTVSPLEGGDGGHGGHVVRARAHRRPRARAEVWELRLGRGLLLGLAGHEGELLLRGDLALHTHLVSGHRATKC